MRRLRRSRAPHAPSRADGGAIGVIIAILLGSGVLLGMGALVIDVGEIYTERAQLQNGSDAAALAVAKSCVTGTCDPSLAPGYAQADANVKAASGKIIVELVCGSVPLGPCPAGSASSPCPPPAGASGYVSVYATTPATGPGALLPPVFAQVLPGYQKLAGTHIRACAQAAWGPPAAAQATSMTLSLCSWQSATNNGTSFGPAPGYGTPMASADAAFRLIVSGSGSGCSGSGRRIFGWAADLTGACALPVSGPRFAAWTGIPVPACVQALQTAQASRQPLAVPVFTRAQRLSGVRQYQLAGFAEFVVTGYHLPGASAPDWLKPANNCTGLTVCVNGYFARGLVPTTGSFGGPDLGATMIELTR